MVVGCILVYSYIYCSHNILFYHIAIIIIMLIILVFHVSNYNYIGNVCAAEVTTGLDLLITNSFLQ